MQALPDPARAFRDVGLRAAPVVHLEVRVDAVAKELRATRPEIGKSGDVLLGRRSGRSMKVDGGMCSFLNPFRLTTALVRVEVQFEAVFALPTSTLSPFRLISIASACCGVERTTR